MLRTITQLVPFGNDSAARNITVLYLANMGPSKTDTDGRFYDYMIAYYEPPSQFSAGLRYFKYITNYDRYASCFAMNHKIYGPDFVWMMEDELKTLDIDKETLNGVISIFDRRAKEDTGWNGQK